MAKLKNLGVMIDVSRNAVMNMDSLKRFLTLLKKMGYNCAMLYTEDTYEIDGDPFFGYMRGRYSKEELREIDEFATSIGMELIPCIQTLAHLATYIRWNKNPSDTSTILLTDDERTYKLIEKMFSSLSQCLSSRKIHIGMDEAHMLGRGTHLDIHGYEDANSIMKRHLARVCEIAEKYGYEVMMWSDMFFRTWNNHGYMIPKTTVPKEIIESVPKNVIQVYWDYYASNEERYIGMIENHRQMTDKLWFAGGVWSWLGLVPSNSFSIKTMTAAIDSCKKKKVDSVIFTMWGDDGAECSHFSQLPALFYLAEYSKGNKDESKIKRKFKSLIGIDYDEFMKIEEPNFILGATEVMRGDHEYAVNPSKYMLHSDYFIGYLDYSIDKEGLNSYEYYRDMAEALHATAKKSRRYGYVFDTVAKLCDVLALKFDLGLRTRRAYQAGDKAELERLANNEYTRLPKLIEIYTRAFEKQWFCDNKPFGFELQDQRLGGLIYRTNACRRRLLDYVSGKISRIDELEVELLPYGKRGAPLSYNNVYKSTTTGAQRTDGT